MHSSDARCDYVDGRKIQVAGLMFVLGEVGRPVHPNRPPRAKLARTPRSFLHNHYRLSRSTSTKMVTLKKLRETNT
jgi:hypothetical protein